MKLLFTSDLHGNAPHYERLRALAESEMPDLIILGGDLLPDDSALDAKSLGTGQPRYVESTFKTAVSQLRQVSGCQDVLVIFGNHDWGSAALAMRQLADQGLVSILTVEAPVRVNGVSFLGYSYSPPTPWFVKDFERLDCRGDQPPLIGGARWDARFSRMVQQGARVLFENLPTIEEDLSKVVVPAQPWVFVIHAPPYDSKLDQSYRGESWGSRAVRAALERCQPLLSLHGHIHESPEVSGSFQDRFGATTAVNPGQSVKSLCYAIIELDVANCGIINIRHGRQS